jgi:hypothetical protein
MHPLVNCLVNDGMSGVAPGQDLQCPFRYPARFASAKPKVPVGPVGRLASPPPLFRLPRWLRNFRREGPVQCVGLGARD